LDPNIHDTLKTRGGRSLKPFVVAAIPAYDEEKTIARVVLEAQRFVDKVVVCDDGSRDMTAEIAERLGADVVRHERNFGYGAALQSLFKRARELGADVMVTLDGDGQHDSSEIPLLAELVLEGKADVVIGSRFLGDLKKMTKLSGATSNYGVSDAESGFRAYGRKALEGLSLFEDGMGVSVEVLMEAKKRGLTVVEVPVPRNYLVDRVQDESLSGMQELNLAIVIPALNEAESIGKVLDETSEVFEGERCMVVVVDGRSKDGTDEIARKKGARIIYQRNTGYGDALRTGFHFVRRHLDANVIVMMDADFTYDPKDITRLVEPVLRDEADLVVGNRFAGMQKGAMPFINRVGNRLLSWFARVTLGLKVHDTQCGLRAFRSELVDSLDLESEGMPLATEMLAEARQAEAKILEMPVAYRCRVGRTKLDPIRDGFKIIGVILRLARDYQPLSFFGAVGFLLAAMGVIIGVGIVIEWITTGTILHLASVSLSSLFIIAGLQIFVIGLIADMIKGMKKYLRKTVKNITSE